MSSKNPTGNWKSSTAVLAAAAMMCFFAAQVRAQEVAVAQVSGQVADPSGKAIAGAQVKMIEVEKNVAHTTVSDPTGRYSLPNLPVGEYRLEVLAEGFRTYTQKGITLRVATNPVVNVKMTIGIVSESIEVTGDATMVETRDNSIAQVLSSQSIVDLPLNGRNPTQLLTLTGGGTSTVPTGNDLTGSKNMGGSNASGTFSLMGSQANGITFLLDGGDNNDAFSNVNLPIPFPDAILEFNVQNNGLPAQYGLHPGGVVNIVTKSGSNAFHGDLFEFLRNGDLNARQAGTLVRDSLKRNQFGGTAGGRIIKDKLFFFGGYQGTQLRSNPAVNTAYVATPATLQGDFSVADGAGCLSKARQLVNPVTKAPYPNNQIPVSTFDHAGLKLGSSYLPPALNACGLAYFGFPSNNPDNQWIGRVDYSLSAKQTMYGRYYIYEYTAQSLFDGTNALTTGTAGNMQRSQTATFGDNYTFTPAMLNAFHLTFNRRRNDRGAAANLFSPNDLGVNMYNAVPNYTQLSVSGYSGGGFNIGCGTCAPGYFNINTYQMADDYTIIHGKHQLAFGFDLRKDQFNSVNNQQANGQFTFNGNFTGDGLADMLVGQFSGLTVGNALSDYLRQTVFALYAQDSFHVTNHLTVNYGVRWEPSLPAYDKQCRGNQFSWPLFEQNVHSTEYPTAPAGLIFAHDSQNQNGCAFTSTHWLTTSPRLGLVWDPSGDGKQTIRTSFNMMHETTELFYPERWTTNPPYASSQTLVSQAFSPTSGPFSDPFRGYVSPTGGAGDPYPGVALFPVGGTYISIPPNLHPTYVMQWNLSYQRQIGKDWLVTAAYVGNATRHIWASTDINYSIPLPGASASNANQRRLTYLVNLAQGQYYGGIQQTDDGATAEYHGLLLKADHRFSQHFLAVNNFTWSHCVSDWDFGGELGNTLYQNPTNRGFERGACSFDHRFVFNSSMVAVSGGFGNGITKTITRDWQLSPIISLISGSPLTLTDGGRDISLSAQLQDRPEVILPNAVYPSTQTVKEWINTAAFAVQATGTFGNLGRNAVYSPGVIQLDVAMSRVFAIRERFKIEVRSDFFNIMNHANWTNPANAPTSSIGVSIANLATFGQITAFGTPRIIQMAAKIYF